MALFDILLNLSANTAALESGLKRAEDRIGQFAATAKSALEFTGITIGLRALGDSFASAAEQGEQLTLLSERLGASAQYLSQLQYAAQTVNVPFAALASSIDIFSRNLVQASEGTGRAKAAIHDLGLDAGALAKLPLDQQLGLIADKIAALPTPTLQTAAAMRIFESSGAELLPILRQGSAGIDELRARADALGVTLGGDTVAAGLAKANAAITDFKAVSHAFWLEFAGDIAPAAAGMTKFLTDLVGGFKNATFGFSSPESELANLQARAKAVQDQLTQLSAGQQGKNLFSRTFGLDAAQIETDIDALGKLNKQIEKLKAQVGTDLQPVQVSAHLIGAPVQDLADVQVTAQKTLTDYMQKYYDGLKTMSETDVERTAAAWEAKENAAKQALAEGLIDVTEYQTRIAALNDEFLSPVEVTAKEKGKIIKTVYDDMQSYAKSAASSIQSDFATALADPTIDNFKKMGIAWLQTLDKMAADAASSVIFQKLFGAPGSSGAIGSGGLGGIMGALLSAVFGNGSSSSGVLEEVASPGLLSLAGYATGGSFDVGGSGGTDSQLTAFWATPGEHVQVGGAGGGGPITIQNFVTVTSPQVTKNDVLGAMQQTQTSTIAKLQDMQRRKKF